MRTHGWREKAVQTWQARAGKNSITSALSTRTNVNMKTVVVRDDQASDLMDACQSRRMV